MIFSVNFLSFCVNICFGCHKEHTHPEGSLSTHNIYFGLRYKKLNLYLTSYLEPCMNAWAELGLCSLHFVKKRSYLY